MPASSLNIETQVKIEFFLIKFHLNMLDNAQHFFNIFKYDIAFVKNVNIV